MSSRVQSLFVLNNVNMKGCLVLIPIDTVFQTASVQLIKMKPPKSRCSATVVLLADCNLGIYNERVDIIRTKSWRTRVPWWNTNYTLQHYGLRKHLFYNCCSNHNHGQLTKFLWRPVHIGVWAISTKNPITTSLICTSGKW